MIKAPTFEIKLDTRRSNKRDQYPVVLYIYFDGKKKLIPVGLHCTQGEYDNCRPDKVSRYVLAEFQDRYKKLQGFEDKAKLLIESLPVFSLDLFVQKWNEPEKQDITTIKHAFQEYIIKLEENDQVGTAITYIAAMNIFELFSPGVLLKDVNIEFLKKFERYMKSEDPKTGKKRKSDTTIGYYVRNLRTIINQAIDAKIITRENYPFGKMTKGKYEIPAGSNIKKALTKEEIKLIYDYKAEPGTHLERARDYWIFIYLANGMNNKDLCRLRYNQIDGNKFTFIRAKIERTTKSKPDPIEVAIHPEMRRILNKYGTKGKADDFVFPILRKGISAYTERNLISDFVKKINRGMKQIAEELGIEKKGNKLCGPAYIRYNLNENW